MWQTIWEYKIQILPIIFSLIIYEIPALIRRMKKLYYVPIYFSIYPLREINQDLSTYLGEDDFYDEGWRLTDEQAEALRKKIIFTSVLSASLDTIVIPLFVGFITAFFLSPMLFNQFLTILIIYKIVAITISVINFHYREISSNKKLSLLIFIYICYIGVIAEMLKTSYFWTYPFVLESNWNGLLTGVTEFLFGKIIAQGLIFALLVAFFVSYIADRKVRENNVSENSLSSTEE